MNILTETPLRVAAIPGKRNFPSDSMTLIVKGTFDLVPGEIARFSEEQDAHSDDLLDDFDAPRYASDFAIDKPRADLLLAGSVYPPRGEAAKSCDCEFAVGTMRRRLVVSGDRNWSNRFLSGSSGEPELFTEMPISYANSYGGVGFARNPVGKGRRSMELENGTRQKPLPNFEDPDSRVSWSGSRRAPAGFGPLAAGWPQRAKKSGTYKRRWQRDRAPWLPKDFDYGYFNAAPEDQQLDGYLTGDEDLRFENLHPNHSRYAASLPGLRVRAFVEEIKDDQPIFSEVSLNLDTLWVDVSEEKLILVWRGVADVSSLDFHEVDRIYVATEGLEETPQSLESHHEAMEQMNQPGEPLEVEEPAPEEPPDPAEIEKLALGEARELLTEMKAPPEVFGVFEGVSGVDEISERMLALNPQAIEDQARIVEESRLRLKQEFEAAGEDPSALDPLPVAEPEPEWTRERVELSHAEGTSFASEDLSGLDLSGLDLGGADLTGCRLREAQLVGCDLTNATLVRASMAGADLSEAVLEGANLSDADLADAVLGGANLNRAILDHADLSAANLASAQLTSIRAGGAILRKADLSGADLSSSVLDDADLSFCILDATRFCGASLQRARLDGAAGAGVDFSEADLSSLRTSRETRLIESRFCKVVSPSSVWEGTTLERCDFSFAQLADADFNRANLSGVEARGCDLRRADLSRAKLAGANLSGTNLFRVNALGAQMQGADLSDANLFEANFEDADVADCLFDGAATKGARFTPDRPR